MTLSTARVHELPGTVDDADFFTHLDAGVDVLQGTVARVGSARLTWSGVAVNLAVSRLEETSVLLAKATATLDGGNTSWQPPVEWNFDPRLERVDLNPTPPRSEVLMLDWKQDAGVA